MYKKLKNIAALVLLASSIFTPLSVAAHEIGLQLYSLREQLRDDLPKTLDQVKEWGIDTVENVDDTWGLTADEFKHQLDKRNIHMASVGTSWEEVRDNPMAVVYKAKYYNATYATFFYIPYIDSISFKFQDAKETVKVMNRSGKILKDNGITLQYHMHGYEFTPHDDGTLADYIIKNVTDAKFQMDVFWVKHGGAEPLALLRKYPGKFSSLHLKDRRKGTPTSTKGQAPHDTNVVLGTGDTNMAGVIKEATRQGIPYWFIEDESDKVMEQIPASLRFLYKQEGRELPESLK